MAWSCSICTFKNLETANDSVCEMCSAKRVLSTGGGGSRSDPIVLDEAGTPYFSALQDWRVC